MKFGVMGRFDIESRNCPPESGGQRDREADPARGGSQAQYCRVAALEPPRRFAPPLLTEEGIRSAQFQTDPLLRFGVTA